MLEGIPFPPEKLTWGCIYFLPGGTHFQRSPLYANGKEHIGEQKTILKVDERSADVLNAQMKLRQRAFFDFEHDDITPSFYPEWFSWQGRGQKGIYSHGWFTPGGMATILWGKYSAFSPAIWFTFPPNGLSHLQVNPNAPASMGGLVNEPHFPELRFSNVNRPWTEWPYCPAGWKG